ncbi:hypothetical protein [Polaribacter sejongensis]
MPFKSNTSCVFGDDFPLLFGVKIPVKLILLLSFSFFSMDVKKAYAL